MAQTFVCDGCGLGDVGTKGAVEQLNLEMTKGINVKLDVHGSARCIVKAVKAAAEKHYTSR